MAWMKWDKLCTPKAYGGMGFRDLRAFNLVLLAKQGWRLQQNSNSLFYWVFKRKYFPDTSFVNAHKGRNPSYVWRSILATQPIIMQGMRWQVGNGQSICVWKDKWLPTQPTYQVISPRTLLPENVKADFLIDAEHGCWIADLVRELFINFEAETILSIPLSISMPLDRLVWSATSNGKFTVKSAYQLAMDMHNAEQERTSEASGQRQLWKSVWSAVVPNRIKNFVQRACQNILPKKSTLYRRQVINNEVCELCDKSCETTTRILLHCDFATSVWEACGLVIDREYTFEDMFWKLSNDSGPSVMDLTHFMVVSWNIWNNRNGI